MSQKNFDLKESGLQQHRRLAAPVKIGFCVIVVC
jgi:hypothetical protein